MLFFLVLVIFISVELAIRSVSYPEECFTQQNTKSASDSKEPAKPFWCFAGWTTADRLTLALVVIGSIQTFVFYEQARRLRETIDKMDEVSRGQTADMARSIAESSRAADAMGNFAESAAKSARAGDAQVRALETQAQHLRGQTSALDVQARLLRASLLNEAPNLVIFGLSRIVEDQYMDEVWYKITYKVINVGRAPAVVRSIREGAQQIYEDCFILPDPVLPWHQLVATPIIQKDETVTINVAFPADQISLSGQYDADGGGMAFDYFTPDKERDVGFFVRIDYAGGTSAGAWITACWRFDHNRNMWLSAEPAIRS